MTAYVAVVGAGGPVGKLCVEQLLDAGRSVKAVVRNPDKYRHSLPTDPKLQIVQGDVTNASSVGAALEGAKGIIFTAAGPSYFGARAVENEGVKNVAAVAEKTGAHVVLLSAALVTPKNRWHPVRILLNNAIRYGMMEEKLAGEAALRESKVSYTIVRPGRFTGQPGTAKILADQRDNTGQGAIPMADVAAVCVAALNNPKARNVTLEVKCDAKKKPRSSDLDTLFDSMLPGVHD